MHQKQTFWYCTVNSNWLDLRSNNCANSIRCKLRELISLNLCKILKNVDFQVIFFWIWTSKICTTVYFVSRIFGSLWPTWVRITEPNSKPSLVHDTYRKRRGCHCTNWFWKSLRLHDPWNRTHSRPKQVTFTIFQLKPCSWPLGTWPF